MSDHDEPRGDPDAPKPLPKIEPSPEPTGDTGADAKAAGKQRGGPDAEAERAPRARRRSTWAPPGPPSMMVMLGWHIAGASFLMGCVLLVMQMLFIGDSPYFALVTYTLTPLGISTGLGMVAVGTFRRWRRYRRGIDVTKQRLPVLDLNKRKVRISLAVFALGVVLFVSVSGVATYRGYHFTESTEFCGTVCHAVMEPEYAAHKTSPHARVGCVSCHIGPGAEWYVRSKASGLRQVYHAVLEDYELPIKVPLENLRPARDTCEQCHWPAKFEGSIERVLWRFWYDRDNTPSRYHLLLKVGGVNPGSGRPEGIHWHSNSEDKVHYWPRDYERQEIPWIEVEHADGSRTVYQDGSITEPPPRAELRTMDCIDCHNRPAHQYLAPDELVDRALAEAKLDRKIPYLKRNAVEVLSGNYTSREDARRTIAGELLARYPDESGMTTELRDATTATLIELYEGHNFPDQGVSFRVYPSNDSHKSAPGCFRCHAGNHQTSEGKKISHDCANCHDFIHQAHGERAFGPVTYINEPFEHPGEDVAGDDDRLCSECHSPAAGWYPGNAEPSRRAKAPADPAAEPAAASAPEPAAESAPAPAPAGPTAPAAQ